MPADTEVPIDAAAVIAQQQEEIERLRQRISDDHFAQDLRDALTTASATGAIGAPVSYSRLIEIIVVTAADIIDARTALLCMIDTEREELVFESAFGDHGTAAAGVRSPLGQGVAGLVALTGQPMAISDTAEDDRDAGDIAEAVGYSPRNILCVPLAFEDEVIGVLELLDKQGADSFDVADMEAIGLFADMAAIAIEQSRTHSRIGAMVRDLIGAVDGAPDYDRHGLTRRAREFTTNLGEQSGFRDALDLARVVQEIVHHGDAAAEACKRILDGFAEYLRTSR
ncbi:GAF domain-containing protein [Mycolicibacterium rufum]|uniref:GAF domain-containing protein n=1 Tax=Mycolicibacterium rufum TaxID=318424 RepID=A0A9X2YBX9_9MYCO|nr:GAF domain-containing protein [Mycolicibacterium rufum]MCV7070490.1 GAF domain-containing protein [Mycolicibacterium rufum]ULP37803.1 GAF domain-containing protein [Mycolicibacterium rufum]